MMRSRSIAMALIPLLLLASCAGRTPNPIALYQPGDDSLDCQALKIQMGYCEQQRAALAPKADKTGSNIVLGVIGFFLIVPLFFMDFSEADKVEMDAYGARYNYLASLYVNKDCGKRLQLPTTEEEVEVLKDDVELQTQYEKQFEQDLQAYTNVSTTEQAQLRSATQYESSIAKERLLNLYLEGKVDKTTYERKLASLDKKYATTPTRAWLVGSWDIQSAYGNGRAIFNSNRTFSRMLQSDMPVTDNGTWELKKDTIVLTIES
ncbi:MAG: hypothetical protein P8M22_11650, partial [Phycisphaerales bacterium]|nr:hypothetical protein [Phycisphaerales bacterium]